MTGVVAVVRRPLTAVGQASVYRVGWTTVALSLGVLGLTAAMVLLKADLLVLLFLGALVGLLVGTLFVPDPAAATPWRRRRHICRIAALCAGAGGALAGLAALTRPIGLLVAVLAGATSPGSFHACRRAMGSVRRPTEAQLDALARSLACMNPMFVPFEVTFDLRELTDDQLGNAWRNSETALSNPSKPRALLRAVEERGRYLDEFERRQPSLLKAWLASDRGTPDSPLLHASASRREPRIDWDELTGGQATDR